MSDLVAIALALALLGANAFFVGAEFALISARRTRIEPRAAAGSRAARTTLRAMENVSLMMAGAQLGITACSLGLGAVGEPAVAHLLEGPFASAGVPEALLHPIAFALALAIVVVLHVVIGEMVPKNVALAGPERTALLLSPPLVVIVRLLRPLIAALNAIANLTLRAAGVTPKDEVTSAFTREEVAGLVDESHREGLLDQEEHELAFGALVFDEQRVGAVLLPLAQLVTIPPTATPAEIEQLAARTGFSRLPVRDGSDALVGYVHLKDVLETDDAVRHRPLDPKRLRPLAHVFADARLRAALATMQRAGTHLAEVRDRDDAVLGVATLEDVIEELVGEVRDETRRQRQPVN